MIPLHSPFPSLRSPSPSPLSLPPQTASDNTPAGAEAAAQRALVAELYREHSTRYDVDSAELRAALAALMAEKAASLADDAWMFDDGEGLGGEGDDDGEGPASD